MVSPPISAFHILANPVGSLCNLDCKYCYYLEKEKLYPTATQQTMSDAVLEQFIQQYIRSQPSNEVNFLWQGGEPTLAGLGFYERALALQRLHANGKKISNALQTNATQLDDEFCAFLKEHDFLLGVSIDGPAHLHNPLRVSKGGSPTLAATLDGLALLKKHQIEFNLLCVVHRQNSNYPMEVYEFLKAIGGRHIQFIPLVERLTVAGDQQAANLVLPDFEGDSQLMEWSVTPADYGQFLIAVFDQWLQTDIGKIHVQLFDVTLENWLGFEPSLCIFRTTCGTALALEKNGDVYSCDHYVFANYKLGNLMSNGLQELVQLPKQVAFGNAKQQGLPRQCRECEVYFACKGECPKNRFAVTADGEPGLNYLCEGYLAFFRHVAPMMNHMSAALMPNFEARRIH